MWEQDYVIAVLCSDLHLSLRPPRARREEPDWFEAMCRPLAQIGEIASHYDVPIVCAGDIFDYWRAEPELVNFALGYLPRMYAIPGQHDLPLHNIELVQRSAFWTMVLAEKIEYLPPGQQVVVNEDLILYGFPWGTEVASVNLEDVEGHFNLAVVHDYIWCEGSSFPGAPESAHVKRWDGKVRGFDGVVVGDNHQGFLTKVGDTPLLNCGTMMRRKTDEVEYEPMVGVLCRSGRVLIQRLSLARDKILTKKQDLETSRNMRTWDMEDFVNGLRDLERRHFDFAEAIEYALKKKVVCADVRELILEALDRG